MAELMEDNTLDADIFDYLIIPSDIYGDSVRFGIQTHSTHPRFSRLFFRTRRPLEEFLDFVQFMRSRHPGVDVPPVPFHEADPDEDPELLRSKVVILRQYIKDLIAIPEIFDDISIPLFLQSRKPMAEIREIIASHEAAAAIYFNRQRANRNAQQAAAAVNNDRQVAGNGGNDQQEAAAANNDRQVAGNGGNAQQEAAAANNELQVGAIDEIAQEAAVALNELQVGAIDEIAQEAAVAFNEQQVGANDGNAQQAAIGNQDGNESSDGELAAGGNASGTESDEAIFQMEDI